MRFNDKELLKEEVKKVYPESYRLVESENEFERDEGSGLERENSVQ